MRILLDENVPVQLRAHLAQHQVASINDTSVGWKNIKNGLLLERMQNRFDVLITADQNIYAQQNLTGRNFSIVVLPTNRRKVVIALGEKIAAVLGGLHIGQYVVFDLSGEAHVRPLASQKE